MTVHILITGASGFIGRHLVAALTREGYQLSLAVRDSERAKLRWPQLNIIQADFACDHNVELWVERLTGVDVVINAVGIIGETSNQSFKALHTDAPCALFKACDRAGVSKVIQISALGADDTALSQYHLSKRAADECLMQQNLSWTILMPSIVYGPGAKSMALFKAMAVLPIIPVLEQGKQQIQPIHIDDLVRVVLRLIQSVSPDRQRIKLVGPKPVSMVDLFAQLRQWSGLGAGRFVSIPYGLALWLANLAERFSATPVTRESVQMLHQGNTADVRPLIDQFGFEPISMQASLAASPASQADYWHAGLYFIRPLLRISLALLWIYTGFISAFVYPQQNSYELLAKAGISDLFAPLMLYGAAAVDCILGLALLMKFRIIRAGLAQIAIVIFYTAIISFFLPEFWMHPFGPVSKNIPLIVATLVMLVLEKR